MAIVFSVPNTSWMSLGTRIRIVIFGMFELRSVSFGVGFDLVAEGIAELPSGIALFRGDTLAGLLWHG